MRGLKRREGPRGVMGVVRLEGVWRRGGSFGRQNWNLGFEGQVLSLKDFDHF